MKETYYFSHDYTPLDDPKLSAFVGKYGAIGYGIFWRIVELLHQEETHKLPHKDYIFYSLSNTMKVDFDEVKIMIDYAINQCELFKSDSDFFYSERVIRNMQKRKDVSNARSESGKKGRAKQILSQTSAEQNLANAEQMPTNAEQNLANVGKGKESKGKEIKEKENKINKEDIEVSFDFKKSLIDFGFDTELVKDWLAVRLKKKSANTKTAFNIFVGQVIKSSFDKNKILELCVCKGWISFNHHWLIDTPDLIQQVEPIQQAITQKEKPMTTLRRYDFRTVYEYFKEVKKRGEKQNPFDYSIPENLREGLSDEDEMILQVDIQKRFPNGLPDEEI